MKYAVHEIFYSLQGEGAQAGRAAVFCRFAGCNLWSGREEDRAEAICRFCDTEFVGTAGDGGGVFQSAEELADAVAACWTTKGGQSHFSGDGAAIRGFQANTAALPHSPEKSVTVPLFGERFVVVTGGEPLLQLDDALVAALRARRFVVAVETNGTRAVPVGVDWICVSPKAGTRLVQRSGDELKLVFPQSGAEPHLFESLAFHYWYLQPLDDERRDVNTEAAVRYCLDHPRWRLSLQRHKFLGLR